MSIYKPPSSTSRVVKKPKSKENQLLVIKHFQPTIINTSRNSSSCFPKVNSDVDAEENVSNTFNRYRTYTPIVQRNSAPPIRVPSRVPSTSANPNNKNFKPRSLSRGQVLQKEKEPPPASRLKSRSRSFPSTNRNQISSQERPKSIKPNTRLNQIIKVDSPPDSIPNASIAKSSHVKNIKAEIQQNKFNRTEGVSNSHLIFEDGKIKRIRDEILESKDRNALGRRAMVSELRSEIAEYKRTGFVQTVYQMAPEYDVEVLAMSDSESDDESAEEGRSNVVKVNAKVIAGKKPPSKIINEPTKEEQRNIEKGNSKIIVDKKPFDESTEDEQSNFGKGNSNDIVAKKTPKDIEESTEDEQSNMVKSSLVIVDKKSPPKVVDVSAEDEQSNMVKGSSKSMVEKKTFSIDIEESTEEEQSKLLKGTSKVIVNKKSPPKVIDSTTDSITKENPVLQVADGLRGATEYNIPEPQIELKDPVRNGSKVKNKSDDIVLQKEPHEEVIKRSPKKEIDRNSETFTESDSQEEIMIKSKIQEANLLIDRVKNALHDIKSIKNRPYSELDAPIPFKQPPLSCCKGRKKSIMKNGNGIRTSKTESITYRRSKQTPEIILPREKPKENHSSNNQIPEILKTIVESAEYTSDLSDHKGTRRHNCCGKRNMRHSHTNTNYIDVESREVQANPISKVACTQKGTAFGKFTQENFPSVSYNMEKPRKSRSLEIQHMPPISIKRELKLQKVLNMDIDNKGHSMNVMSSTPVNVGYMEYSADKGNEQTDPKISFYDPDGTMAQLRSKYHSQAAFHDVHDVDPGLKKKYEEKHLEENESRDTTSRETVLKSFHLYDNPNYHDPGRLTKKSINKLRIIDESIYKTYINPEGVASEHDKVAEKSTKQKTKAIKRPISAPSKTGPLKTDVSPMASEHGDVTNILKSIRDIAMLEDDALRKSFYVKMARSRASLGRTQSVEPTGAGGQRNEELILQQASEQLQHLAAQSGPGEVDLSEFSLTEPKISTVTFEEDFLVDTPQTEVGRSSREQSRSADLSTEEDSKRIPTSEEEEKSSEKTVDASEHTSKESGNEITVEGDVRRVRSSMEPEKKSSVQQAIDSQAIVEKYSVELEKKSSIPPLLEDELEKQRSSVRSAIKSRSFEKTVETEERKSSISQPDRERSIIESERQLTVEDKTGIARSSLEKEKQKSNISQPNRERSSVEPEIQSSVQKSIESVPKTENSVEIDRSSSNPTPIRQGSKIDRISTEIAKTCSLSSTSSDSEGEQSSTEPEKKSNVPSSTESDSTRERSPKKSQRMPCCPPLITSYAKADRTLVEVERKPETEESFKKEEPSKYQKRKSCCEVLDKTSLKIEGTLVSPEKKSCCPPANLIVSKAKCCLAKSGRRSEDRVSKELEREPSVQPSVVKSDTRKEQSLTDKKSSSRRAYEKSETRKERSFIEPEKKSSIQPTAVPSDSRRERTSGELEQKSSVRPLIESESRRERASIELERKSSIPPPYESYTKKERDSIELERKSSVPPAVESGTRRDRASIELERKSSLPPSKESDVRQERTSIEPEKQLSVTRSIRSESKKERTPIGHEIAPTFSPIKSDVRQERTSIDQERQPSASRAIRTESKKERTSIVADMAPIVHTPEKSPSLESPLIARETTRSLKSTGSGSKKDQPQGQPEKKPSPVTSITTSTRDSQMGSPRVSRSSKSGKKADVTVLADVTEEEEPVSLHAPSAIIKIHSTTIPEVQSEPNAATKIISPEQLFGLYDSKSVQCDMEKPKAMHAMEADADDVSVLRLHEKLEGLREDQRSAITLTISYYSLEDSADSAHSATEQHERELKLINFETPSDFKRQENAMEDKRGGSDKKPISGQDDDESGNEAKDTLRKLNEKYKKMVETDESVPDVKKNIFTMESDQNKLDNFIGFLQYEPHIDPIKRKKSTDKKKHRSDDLINPLPSIRRFTPVESSSRDEEKVIFLPVSRRYNHMVNKRRPFNQTNLKHYNVETSNSDSVTVESMSEGEVKCKHSVSIGEVHKCESLGQRAGKVSSSSRRVGITPFGRGGGITVEEKKNYFNNWVTYYVKRCPDCVDDSTSTSTIV